MAVTEIQKILIESGVIRHINKRYPETRKSGSAPVVRIDDLFASVSDGILKLRNEDEAIIRKLLQRPLSRPVPLSRSEVRAYFNHRPF